MGIVRFDKSDFKRSIGFVMGLIKNRSYHHD